MSRKITKNYILLALGLIIIATALILLLIQNIFPKENILTPTDNTPKNNNLVGDDKDEHGCLASAGYSWCPTNNKCQRMWEEYCEDFKEQYRGVVQDDLIRLAYPRPEDSISSPLEIKGEARGSWFFEGSFPIILTDWDGKIIAETTAQAQGDWMTEDYVPFTATLNFTPDTQVSNRGSLILKNDNPSGLPANDKALEITIFFK